MFKKMYKLCSKEQKKQVQLPNGLGRTVFQYASFYSRQVPDYALYHIGVISQSTLKVCGPGAVILHISHNPHKITSYLLSKPKFDVDFISIHYHYPTAIGNHRLNLIKVSVASLL